MTNKKNPESCCRYKDSPRNEDTLRQLRNRINRITGQLSGIQKMLDENRYCGDILTQIAAAESALQSVGYIILQEHIQTCVAEKLKQGSTEILTETIDLIKKLK